MKKQPKRLDPDEIKTRKISTDKSGGSQDERSSTQQTPKSTSNDAKTKPSHPSHQQPQLTNKVAQAISAVKAKVIPPKEKSKQDTASNSNKKSSVDVSAQIAPSDVNLPSEKLNQTNSINTGKKKLSNPNISTGLEIKSKEEKQPLAGRQIKPPVISEKVVPAGKMSSAQPVSLQPLQASKEMSRPETEAKMKQGTHCVENIQKQKEETQSTKQGFEEVEPRSETVKKAAERFEKETMKANSRGRSSGTFGGYRERSKSIGHSLAKRISTDVEDADYEEESITTSSSMLPWANESGMGKSSTSAVVKKRNSMRGVGAYQLQMSKSSDSITAAKMLAEARMRGSEEDQAREGGGLKGRQNYHQQKALRINAQNYGGVGGRGEMSKSIEKQIDVYTKTREDIRRILTVAKKLSVADRVKLLDNQQVDPEPMLAMEAENKHVETAVKAQASGVLKSRYSNGYSKILL